MPTAELQEAAAAHDRRNARGVRAAAQVQAEAERDRVLYGQFRAGGGNARRVRPAEAQQQAADARVGENLVPTTTAATPTSGKKKGKKRDWSWNSYNGEYDFLICTTVDEIPAYPVTGLRDPGLLYSVKDKEMDKYTIDGDARGHADMSTYAPKCALCYSKTGNKPLDFDREHYDSQAHKDRVAEWETTNKLCVEVLDLPPDVRRMPGGAKAPWITFRLGKAYKMPCIELQLRCLYCELVQNKKTHESAASVVRFAPAERDANGSGNPVGGYKFSAVQFDMQNATASSSTWAAEHCACADDKGVGGNNTHRKGAWAWDAELAREHVETYGISKKKKANDPAGARKQRAENLAEVSAITDAVDAGRAAILKGEGLARPDADEQADIGDGDHVEVAGPFAHGGAGLADYYQAFFAWDEAAVRRSMGVGPGGANDAYDELAATAELAAGVAGLQVSGGDAATEAQLIAEGW